MQSNSSLSNDIEELVKKAAEANKVLINEGTKLVQQMGKTGGGKKEIPSVKPELLMDAFNAMAKMNIQYASRMIDLGVAFAKQFSGSEDSAGAASAPDISTEETAVDPAFVLTATVKAGDTVQVPFLLDNIKEATVICQLSQSAFTLQDDKNSKADIRASFDPQAFPLEPSETKKVTITVDTQKDNTPGVYECHIQVIGFEPAYFTLLLTVE